MWNSRACDVCKPMHPTWPPPQARHLWRHQNLPHHRLNHGWAPESAGRSSNGPTPSSGAGRRTSPGVWRQEVRPALRSQWHAAPSHTVQLATWRRRMEGPDHRLWLRLFPEMFLPPHPHLRPHHQQQRTISSSSSTAGCRPSHVMCHGHHAPPSPPLS